MQPRRASRSTTPANPGFPHLQAIDAQVDAAVADGLQVILMPYRYPRWVNHTTRARRDEVAAWRLPDAGHGPYSPWATFVEALWQRYAGRMACFEVVNEPNLQLWPQDGVAERVAWMISTVDAIAAPARPRGDLPRRRRSPTPSPTARGGSPSVRRSSTRCCPRSSGAGSRAATTGSGRSTTTTTASSAATA